jgi:isopenicillin-N N-acyltransferase-like protein
MLPAHQSYAPDLYTEMVATGDAAGLTPAEMIVVGGFTDFVDAVRGTFGSAPIEDTCTAFIVPDDRADGAGFFGQTWDMHDSATEHIVMLDVGGDDDPRALVFTTVGCVGQIGMNGAGIAVGINNLTAAGNVGVTWPFVVRKALQQRTIEDATACVVDADLSGAHNYLLFDDKGNGVSIEAMPDALGIEMLEDTPVVHTNHCRRPLTRAEEAPRPATLQASSKARLARAIDLLNGATFTIDDLMALTRDPEAICQVAAPPYHVESCGAAIMRPKTGEFWAVAGRPDLNEYERFSLA